MHILGGASDPPDLGSLLAMCGLIQTHILRLGEFNEVLVKLEPFIFNIISTVHIA